MASKTSQAFEIVRLSLQKSRESQRGHIVNRLQLTDRNHRKAYSCGQMYAIEREDVLDMMRRYGVLTIER